jgi:hypothetical protein
LGGCEGIGVEVQRKVAAEEAQLAGVDVLLSNLPEGGQVELPAERALCIRILDHGERRVLRTQVVSALDFQVGLSGLRGSLRSLFLEKPANLPQFVQNRVGLLASDAAALLLGSGAQNG